MSVEGGGGEVKIFLGMVKFKLFLVGLKSFWKRVRFSSSDLDVAGWLKYFRGVGGGGGGLFEFFYIDILGGGLKIF